MCELVEEMRPEVVSFHFGLPDKELLDRVKAAGCKVLSSATIVEEASWLENRGCDAIIAQGNEAGGHRAMFLTDEIASQPGTLALVPQIADAVSGWDRRRPRYRCCVRARCVGSTDRYSILVYTRVAHHGPSSLCTKVGC